jgi:hypothetical protein
VTPRDRRGAVYRIGLAAEILSTYVTVRRLIRSRTLPETVAVLRRGVGDGAEGDASSLAIGRHLASATVRTITLVPADSRCLMRSLVLTRMMARRRIGSTFVLSVAPPPAFEAHAWVEHGGRALLEPARGEHRSMLRL